MRLVPRLPDGRRFSWQVDLRLIILAFVVLFGFLAPWSTTTAAQSTLARAAPPNVFSRSRTHPRAVSYDARDTFRSIPVCISAGTSTTT